MQNTDNLIQLGTIVGVDTANRALVRVQIDDRVTDWIPYAMKASSHVKIWIPPQIGEQVEVHSTYADADNGVAYGSIYNQDCKEPLWANDHTSGIEFSDGTVMKYDTTAKALMIAAVGSITITAPAGISVTADTAITGDVTIDGNLKVNGTITDEKGSVTSHEHTDVMTGSANSGDRA